MTHLCCTIGAVPQNAKGHFIFKPFYHEVAGLSSTNAGWWALSFDIQLQLVDNWSKSLYNHEKPFHGLTLTRLLFSRKAGNAIQCKGAPHVKQPPTARFSGQVGHNAEKIH
jgi:hypothetical protein